MAWKGQGGRSASMKDQKSMMVGRQTPTWSERDVLQHQHGGGTNIRRRHPPADMHVELRSSCRASSSPPTSLRWTRHLRPCSRFRTEAGLEPPATALARSSMTPGWRRGSFECRDAEGKRDTSVSQKSSLNEKKMSSL